MGNINDELEAQLAKFIARCLYQGIFIYDVEWRAGEITLHYKPSVINSLSS